MSSAGNPHHDPLAESSMKTLNGEEVYLAGYETFDDVKTGLPRFMKTSATSSACTPRLATGHQWSSKPDSLSRRLSSDEPNGPARRVHST